MLTLTARGSDGTTAAAHTADDSVQECLRYNETTVSAIVNDLLVDYANVDPSYITIADWQEQEDTLIALTTGVGAAALAEVDEKHSFLARRVQVDRGEGWSARSLAEHLLPALEPDLYGLEASAEVFSWDPV